MQTTTPHAVNLTISYAARDEARILAAMAAMAATGARLTVSEVQVTGLLRRRTHARVRVDGTARQVAAALTTALTLS
jgi:hypothetical protein